MIDSDGFKNVLMPGSLVALAQTIGRRSALSIYLITGPRRANGRVPAIQLAKNGHGTNYTNAVSWISSTEKAIKIKDKFLDEETRERYREIMATRDFSGEIVNL